MPNVLDATGIQIKSLTEISDSIKARLHAVYPNMDLTPESFDGQAIDSVSREIRSVGELVLACAASRDPGQAVGFQLRALAAGTGTTPDVAAASYVPCTVNVDPGTYNPGDLVASLTSDPTKRWENLDPVVNGGGAAANFTGIRFICQQTGVIVAGLGDLNVIAETFPGWNSVANTEATTGANSRLGFEAESDSSLRVHQQTDLARSGSTTADAVRAELLAEGRVPGILDARVVLNDSDVTDGDGVPPHSIWVIARGGTDFDVANVGFREKAGGVQMFGAISVALIDDQGNPQVGKLSRPTEIPIYVSVTVTGITTEYVGDTELKRLIQESIGTGGQGFSGRDVTLSQLRKAVLNAGGVWEQTALTFGVAPAPVGTSTIVMAPNQYPSINVANVVVTSSLISGPP